MCNSSSAHAPRRGAIPRTVLALIALLAAPLYSQEPRTKRPPGHPKVDQERVDEAIERACRWLLEKAPDPARTVGHARRHQSSAGQCYLELFVLTLAHSGLYDSDRRFQALAQAMAKREIATTYSASLQAMALQKIDAKKYQWRIAQCAQFLVDNQAENGQWDYGEPTNLGRFPPPSEDEPIVVTEEAADPKIKKSSGASGGSTRLLPQIPVRAGRKGPPSGDNSNSQYAALGLRAALDAGIQIDKEVLSRARKWWQESQNKDGGWGYCENGERGGDVTADESKNGPWSYGSMTVGGVGSLCIYGYFLKEDFRRTPAVLRGLDWIAKNYDLRKNPRHSDVHLYYLYGLERAGILYGTETFGGREWYPEGARILLDAQKPDGTWDIPDDPMLLGTANACFAVLFLRRGTPPLFKIATGDGKR